MPQDKTDPPLMSYQVYDWFVEVAVESNVWNLPDLDGTIFTGTGYHFVIVRTPLNVEHSGTMTSY